MSDPVAVALSVAQILEACGLRYLVGGSLASSMSGEPRSTLDVDIVVAMTVPDIDRLVDGLRDEFDVDEHAAARAVRERSSVNVFHVASAIKVDLFVMGGSPLDDEQMNRRQRVQVTTNPDRYLYAYTPEDILLQKLRWLRGARGILLPVARCTGGYCWSKVTGWTGFICGTGPAPSASAWLTCSLGRKTLPAGSDAADLLRIPSDQLVACTASRLPAT